LLHKYIAFKARLSFYLRELCIFAGEMTANWESFPAKGRGEPVNLRFFEVWLLIPLAQNTFK